MRTQAQRAETVMNRIADRLDLAIDLLTLGQYGLEQVPSDGPGCEGSGRQADWEALQMPARRRGHCRVGDREPARSACRAG